MPLKRAPQNTVCVNASGVFEPKQQMVRAARAALKQSQPELKCLFTHSAKLCQSTQSTRAQTAAVVASKSLAHRSFARPRPQAGNTMAT